MKKPYKIVKKRGKITDSASDITALKERATLLTEELELLSNELISKIEKKEESLIPVSIFKGKRSPLEALVLYLIEDGLSINEISEKLNRGYTTIWTTLKKARETKQKLNVKSDLFVNLEIFEKKKLSILESIVIYLKKEKNFRLKDIAQILNKDPRTIWTVMHRAKAKLGGGRK